MPPEQCAETSPASARPLMMSKQGLRRQRPSAAPDVPVGVVHDMVLQHDLVGTRIFGTGKSVKKNANLFYHVLKERTGNKDPPPDSTNSKPNRWSSWRNSKSDEHFGSSSSDPGKVSFSERLCVWFHASWGSWQSWLWPPKVSRHPLTHANHHSCLAGPLSAQQVFSLAWLHPTEFRKTFNRLWLIVHVFVQQIYCWI